MVFHFSSSFSVTCFVQSSTHNMCVLDIFFSALVRECFECYILHNIIHENVSGKIYAPRENVYKCLDLNITAYVHAVLLILPYHWACSEKKNSVSVWMVWGIEEMEYGKCWWVYDSRTLCKHCCFMLTLFKAK